MDYMFKDNNGKVVGIGSDGLYIEDTTRYELDMKDEAYINYLKKIEAVKDITDTKEWFNIYYRNHEEEYRRLISLEINCDDGSNPKDKLKELYQEAEIKRKKIQELEKLI